MSNLKIKLVNQSGFNDQDIQTKPFIGTKSKIKAIEPLLNSFIREFAIPNELINFQYCAVSGILKELSFQYTRWISIKLFDEQCLIIGIKRKSLINKITFSGDVFLETQTGEITKLEYSELCILILSCLAQLTGTNFNLELLQQIQNSVEITELFLDKLRTNPKYHQLQDHPASVMLKAEQDMVWGHVFHPAPKSRFGLNFDKLLECSPEVRACFKLYGFKVKSHIISTFYMDEKKDNGHEETINYFCHPWEVDFITCTPLFKKAIKNGDISILGEFGETYYATSSVRTLYQPKYNQFTKFSIHLRMTNCIRKLSDYELKTAVLISRLMTKLKSRLPTELDFVELLPEIQAQTLNFDHLVENESDAEQSCFLYESFSQIIRQGINNEDMRRYQPQMAAALFGNDENGTSIILQQLSEFSSEKLIALDDLVIDWFADYCDMLLTSCFCYFFKYGVALESHLQNVLIGFENGFPKRLWFRDMQGVKLISNFWSKTLLSELNQKELESVYYEHKKGWSRVAYCTLVNNLSEAIFHLSDWNNELETRLWSVVSDLTIEWMEKYGRYEELTQFTEGAPIHYKKLLSSRVKRLADKKTNFGEISNPLKT